MRANHVSWIIEVHHKLKLNPDTLYITVNIMDRFCIARKVARSQLIGIASLLIACKYEEIKAPKVYDMLLYTNN